MAPIIDRISGGQLGFKLVDGVESLAAIAELAAASFPAAFVVQANERMTEEQNGPGLIVITVDATFDVAIVIRASATRGQNRDTLTALAEAVTTRLLGWTPDAATYRPFTPVSGQLIAVEGGNASWAVRFRTVYRIRKQG